MRIDSFVDALSTLAVVGFFLLIASVIVFGFFAQPLEDQYKVSRRDMAVVFNCIWAFWAVVTIILIVALQYTV